MDQAENTTRDTPTPWDPGSDPDGYTVDDVDSKDWFLDTVLDFAHGLSDDNTGGYVGLTVTCGGVVASGLAISRRDWIAGTIDLQRAGGDSESTQLLHDLFVTAHTGVVGEAVRRTDSDSPQRARGFLHMKDVQLGVGTATTQVQLWRGALEDISSWSLGSWNPTPTPPQAF